MIYMNDDYENSKTAAPSASGRRFFVVVVSVVVTIISSVLRNKVRKNVELATAQLGLSGRVPIT